MYRCSLHHQDAYKEGNGKIKFPARFGKQRTEPPRVKSTKDRKSVRFDINTPCSYKHSLNNETKHSACKQNSCATEDEPLPRCTIHAKEERPNEYIIQNPKDRIATKSLPHTDCKYCLQDESELENKTKFFYTDCKYCLHNRCHKDSLSETSSSSSIIDEELAYDFPPELCRSCETPHIFNEPYFYKPHGSKILIPSNYSSAFHGPCKYNFSHSKNHYHHHNFEPSHYKLHELGEYKSNFRVCEYCLRQGESAVIYNSHQFKDKSGSITCPVFRCNICRDHPLMTDYHHSAIPDIDSLSYREMIRQKELNDYMLSANASSSWLDSPQYHLRENIFENTPRQYRRLSKDVTTPFCCDNIARRNVPCGLCYEENY